MFSRIVVVSSRGILIVAGVSWLLSSFVATTNYESVSGGRASVASTERMEYGWPWYCVYRRITTKSFFTIGVPGEVRPRSIANSYEVDYVGLIGNIAATLTVWWALYITTRTVKFPRVTLLQLQALVVISAIAVVSYLNLKSIETLNYSHGAIKAAHLPSFYLASNSVCIGITVAVTVRQLWIVLRKAVTGRGVSRI